MRSIWLVSRGEYSDYSVDYICLDESTAINLCKKLNVGNGDYLSQYDVEERPLIESTDQVVREVHYIVQLTKEGTEKKRWSYTSDHLADDPERADRAEGWPEGITATSTRSYAVALRLAREKYNNRKDHVS